MNVRDLFKCKQASCCAESRKCLGFGNAMFKLSSPCHRLHLQQSFECNRNSFLEVFGTNRNVIVL